MKNVRLVPRTLLARLLVTKLSLDFLSAWFDLVILSHIHRKHFVKDLIYLMRMDHK